MAITESWLSDGYFSSEFFPPSYSVFRTDRNFAAVGGDRGGGVLLAVRGVFRSERFELPALHNASLSIDAVGCKIYTSDSNYLIAIVIYIPPLPVLVCLRIFWIVLVPLTQLMGRF